jgi:WD40 repeat protein
MKKAYYTRRDALLGCLTVGAALTGGFLFTGSSSWSQGTDGADKGANSLQLALSWSGLDFTWLSDNTRLAIASDDGLSVVKTSNGQLQRQNWPRIDSPSLQNNVPANRSVYWSSDGTKVLSTTATTLFVLDVLTGHSLWNHKIDPTAASIVALSPDGTHIAIAQSSPASTTPAASVQIWSVAKGILVAQFDDRSTPLLAVKSTLWSPDSTRIVTTSQKGTLQVWQVSNGHLLQADETGSRQALSWSPDGSNIAFVSNGTDGQAQLGLWNAIDGQVYFQTPALVSFPTDQRIRDNQVAWSPDGTRVSFSALAGETSRIEVWSIQDRKRLFICQSVNTQPSIPTWSPDGKYLAAGQTIVGGGELIRGDNGERSVIQFWNARNGEALFTYSAPKSPQRLTWAPDSRSLAIITPRAYGALANSSCISFCRYGYNDYALEVFRMG